MELIITLGFISLVGVGICMYSRNNALKTEITALKSQIQPIPDVVDLSEYIKLTVHEGVVSTVNKLREIRELENNELRQKCIKSQADADFMEGKAIKLTSNQKSEQVRLGFISEKLAPFLDDFKHTPEGLVPVFKPIDYIHFGEDKITFIEVKSGNSRLTKKQKSIKMLIEEKKVEFEEYRV